MSEDGRNHQSAPDKLANLKFGWAYDIVAPRQEIDTLSRLYEEATIQSALDGLQLKPKDFLAAHRQAREDYRKGKLSLEPSVTETVNLTQDLALFGAQASARARRKSSDRAVLSCNCPDEPGVLADVAKAIVDQGGEFIGAFMSVVAGHFVNAFLLSGSGIDPETLCPGREDLTVGYMRGKAYDIEWPHPGSSCWHASARLRGPTSLLLELTREIGKREIPLIALTHWREKDGKGEDIQVVDLNFALAPRPPGEDLQTVRDLEAAVQARLDNVQLDITHVISPTQYRYKAQSDVVSAKEGDVIMTVVGRSQPLFVHDVLRTLEDIEAILDMRGSSMAILEGVCVLTIVLARAPQISEEQLERRIEKDLSKLRESRPIERVRVVKASRIVRNDESAWPTHELRIQAAEQSRVVAEVASLLTDAKANISWFVSRVLDPVVGERAPVSAIEMHFHLPKETRADRVEARLRTLAESRNWHEAHMAPWSLDR
jgi:glycine cleavage system regulatory protein